MPKGKAEESSSKSAASKKAATNNNTGKKTTTDPKSVLDKIVYAIRNTPQQGTNGVSRVSLAKYLKAEFDYDNASAFKLALKKGVSSNVLEQVGQSFRVKGDAVIEPVELEEDKLIIEDLTAGGNDEDDDSQQQSTTAVAQHGDNVTVKYVGTLADNGVQFDAANSFTFQLGAGDVIKGWDKGIVGMRVGGKRKLIVPSKLGYGKRGCSPDIPPNSTLHFIVTLKKISRP